MRAWQYERGVKGALGLLIVGLALLARVAAAQTVSGANAPERSIFKIDGKHRIAGTDISKTGTGFLVSHNGHIVTARHIVGTENAAIDSRVETRSAIISFGVGAVQAEAGNNQIRVSKELDLALLQIRPPEGREPLCLAERHDVGQKIRARAS